MHCLDWGFSFKVAFEWPRHIPAWNLPEVQELRKFMMYECNFDGAYGLQDKWGAKLRKPWRIISSMPELIEPLSRLCSGTHEHGQCRGREAERSGYYTDELVEVIGRAITKSCQKELHPVRNSIPEFFRSGANQYWLSPAFYSITFGWHSL